MLSSRALLQRDFRNRRAEEENQYRNSFQRERREMCQFCANYHSHENKCYEMCNYCHQMHFIKEYLTPSRICPLLQKEANKLQSRNALQCSICGGQGFFELKTTVQYCQPRDSYNVRLRSYEEQKEKRGKAKGSVPKLKVYMERVEYKRQRCDTCLGEGKVPRVIDCCKKGCQDCDLSGVKVNPKWVEVKLKGEPTLQAFPCRFCRKTCHKQSKIIKLACDHAFHWRCGLQYLMISSGRCFTCKQKDPYLELAAINDIERCLIQHENQPNSSIGYQFDCSISSVSNISDIGQKSQSEGASNEDILDDFPNELLELSTCHKEKQRAVLEKSRGEQTEDKEIR